MDGQFDSSDRFKSLKLHQLEYDFLDKYLYYLNNFSNEMLQEMAVKYLNPDDLITVVAG
jgi:hypothetical protein